MRDLSWNVFANTGDVESYLLFKQMARKGPVELELSEEDYDIEAGEEQYDDVPY